MYEHFKCREKLFLWRTPACNRRQRFWIETWVQRLTKNVDIIGELCLTLIARENNSFQHQNRISKTLTARWNSHQFKLHFFQDKERCTTVTLKLSFKSSSVHWSFEPTTHFYTLLFRNFLYYLSLLSYIMYIANTSLNQVFNTHLAGYSCKTTTNRHELSFIWRSQDI